MSGWLKLHRKTLQSDMYRSLNSKQRDVMMTLLMMANHKERTWEWKGELYKTEPGQVITSLKKIKENCASDVSVQSIRTALLKLEKWGFLTNEATKSGRLITIVKWGVYQRNEDEAHKDTNKEPTKDQQSSNKELTPNKNVKNDKEDNIPFSAIVDYLNEKTGSSYRSGTEKTKRHIRARWAEGFRLSDFKRVIDVKTAEWQSTDMAKYLRPETLFGTKFESYLNQQTKPEPVDFEERRMQKERENFDRKIKLQRWVEAGNDPSEFVYRGLGS